MTLSFGEGKKKHFISKVENDFNTLQVRKRTCIRIRMRILDFNVIQILSCMESAINQIFNLISLPSILELEKMALI